MIKRTALPLIANEERQTFPQPGKIVARDLAHQRVMLKRTGVPRIANESPQSVPQPGQIQLLRDHLPVWLACEPAPSKNAMALSILIKDQAVYTRCEMLRAECTRVGGFHRRTTATKKRDPLANLCTYRGEERGTGLHSCPGAQSSTAGKIADLPNKR
jgi:hypothetical protein